MTTIPIKDPELKISHFVFQLGCLTDNVMSAAGTLTPIHDLRGGVMWEAEITKELCATGSTQGAAILNVLNVWFTKCKVI